MAVGPLGWAPAGRPLVGQRELLWEGDDPQFLFPGSGRGEQAGEGQGAKSRCTHEAWRNFKDFI